MAIRSTRKVEPRRRRYGGRRLGEFDPRVAEGARLERGADRVGAWRRRGLRGLRRSRNGGHGRGLRQPGGEMKRRARADRTSGGAGVRSGGLDGTTVRYLPVARRAAAAAAACPPSPPPGRSASTPPTFAGLNPAQRRRGRVRHRRRRPGPGPLLVIAGAGSGKTLTLAQRVARLVLGRRRPAAHAAADVLAPRRRSRWSAASAASLHEALGLRADAAARRACPGAGTFHAIGARLLREYAAAHRPRPSLHDPRPRRRRGPDRPGAPASSASRATEQRFPAEGHLPGDLLARGQRAARRSPSVLQRTLPWCSRMGGRARSGCSPPTSTPSRRSTCSTTTTCCSTGREMLAEPALAREIGARFDHVLVDEYQDTNRLQAAILPALKPDGRGAHRGRRRRAGDLFVPRRRRCATSSTFRGRSRRRRASSRSSATTARRSRSSTPSNAVIALAAERHAKDCGASRRRRQRPRARLRAPTRPSRRAGWPTQVLRAARGGHRARSARRCCSAPRTTARALELELARRNIPFVKFGGLKFLEAAHIKDVLAVLRLAAEPARPDGRLSRARSSCPASARPPRARLLDAMAAAADPAAALRSVRAAAAAARRLAAFAALLARCARRRRAGRPRSTRSQRWYVPQLERLHDDAAVARAPTSRSSRGIAAGYAVARALPDRADARPARARRATKPAPPQLRRGLPDPVDHPFRQGPGVERGVRAQRASTAASRRTWRPAARPRSRRSGACSTSR